MVTKLSYFFVIGRLTSELFLCWTGQYFHQNGWVLSIADVMLISSVKTLTVHKNTVLGVTLIKTKGSFIQKPLKHLLRNVLLCQDHTSGLRHISHIIACNPWKEKKSLRETSHLNTDSSSMDTKRIYAIRLYIWRTMRKELKRSPIRQKPVHTNPAEMCLHATLVSLLFGVKRVENLFCEESARRMKMKQKMRRHAHSVWQIWVNMLVDTKNQINSEIIFERKTMSPHVHWAKTTAILQFVLLAEDTLPALLHWW